MNFYFLRIGVTSIMGAILFGTALPCHTQNSTTSVSEEPKTMASIWIEAEDFQASNFISGIGPSNVTADSPGASGALWMYLASPHPPDGKDYFYADYDFTVKTPGLYRLWAATTPQNEGWASGFSLIIDQLKPVHLMGRPFTSNRFGTGLRNHMGWMDGKSRHLEPGKHRLRVMVKEPSGKQAHGIVDAFLLTTDVEYIPQGDHPKYSTQPEWNKVLAGRSPEEFQKQLNLTIYKKKMSQSLEDISEKSRADTIKKILSRPIPPPNISDPGPHEFGVHGMEIPFVKVGVDEDKIKLVYEYLARAGVQSFRTAESCWHRLGENYDNYKELDFQVESAAKYGMTQLFTVGYPPYPFCMGQGLSACKPEFRETKYRDYLEKLFSRYQGRDVIRYTELGNEIDAASTWWSNSTPEMYVEEMKIVNSVVRKSNPHIKIVAFGATHSRSDSHSVNGEGRLFIRKCMDLGIHDYVDGYSIHYAWALAEKELPAFFKQEMRDRKLPSKFLIDTESTSYGRPSDVIKTFARNFYINEMPRVDYYLARDFFENGGSVTSALFDLEWNPKPRLLAYAASVDGMKFRKLVGMAEPAPGIEAYVLEKIGRDGKAVIPKDYSVVLWRNGPNIKEMLEPQPMFGKESSVLVSGLKGLIRAEEWNLDEAKLGEDKMSIHIDDQPKILFCSELPQWKLISNHEWLDRQGASKRESNPVVPVFK
jgi:hypothetical protein